METVPALASRLDALARHEAGDRVRLDAKHAADAHRVEAAGVDEAPDRLRVDAERVRDLADAVQVAAHARNLPQGAASPHGPNGPLRVGTVPVVRTVLLALLVLLLAGCGTSAAKPPPARQPQFSGGELSPPRPAPPIALRDAHGRRFTLAGQKGRYTLVTFLYTRCPDVCPLIASNLNTALRTLGPKANVDVLAVSVDPKGDTPAAVRAYERRMHLTSHFHFLIGSRPQLHRVWAAWHVLSVAKAPDLVDHVSYVALVDPAGKQRLLYGSDVHARAVLHDLKLLRNQPA
jgi:protein SCO1